MAPSHCVDTRKRTRREPRPLESNQNLSGFSRARRPTTQERDTSAARAGHIAARCTDAAWSRCASQDRAAQIIIIVLRLSESGPGAGRTSGVGASALRAGAPRAFMRPRLRQAHLGPWCVRLAGGRTYRDSLSVFEISSRKISSGLTLGKIRPETSKGRPVLPGRPSSARRVLTRYASGRPPQVPVSSPIGQT